MKRRRLLLLFLVGALFVGVVFLPRTVRFIRIGLGYAATITALQHFGSGFPLERIRSERLPPELAFIDLELDPESQTAEASFGLWSVEARYVQGLGATRQSPEPISLPERLDAIPRPPKDLPWPLGSGDAVQETDATRRAVLEDAVDAAFFDPHNGADLGTHAVVVAQGGQLIFERYAPGIGPETPLLGWSMTKTVTALLIGRLVHTGALSLDDPAPVPAWENKVTIEHLLRMQSGVRWRQNYERQDCDSLRMLFLARGAGEYAAAAPLEHEPGTRWMYCDGSSNVLAHIVKTAARPEPLGFPARSLFAPLGMATASISVDGTGTFVGSSLMLASGRDWARVGQLFLQDGVWDGERLLPEGFVAFCTRASAGSAGRYGAHLWLFPDSDEPLLEGAYYASGYQGQSLIVVPRAGAVLLRLGVEPEFTEFDDVLFATRILQALTP